MTEKIISLGAAALLLASATGASADTVYDWTFTSSSISAAGSVDVDGTGHVTAGGGTITDVAASLSGASLTLMTTSPNPGGCSDPTCFTGVFTGGNIQGDTVYNANGPGDANGLVFSVNGPYTYGTGDGFNIWWNGGTSYTGFLTAPKYTIEDGTFTSTPVPVPAAGWLFPAALGLIGLVRRKASS